MGKQDVLIVYERKVFFLIYNNQVEQKIYKRTT